MPADFCVNHGRGAPAKIHGGHSHRFVHRHQEISRAQDAAFAAQSFVEELTKHNTHILYGMVLVDIKIAASLKLEIESAMMGEKFQHVIEETNASRDHILAAAIDIE